MKHTTRFLLSIIFFSLFVGCKTTYRATQPQIAEPTELENVLLVGRITIEFSDNPEPAFSEFSALFPSGSHTKNIRLRFANKETGEEYHTNTLDESGLFCLRVRADIEINFIYLDLYSPRTSTRAYSFELFDPFSEPKKTRAIRTFQTGSGQVLDLGHIRHVHGVVSLFSTFEQSPEEGKNQALFLEKFPESEWNQFAWNYKDMGGFPFLPQGI